MTGTDIQKTICTDTVILMTNSKRSGEKKKKANE